jgi:2-dehydro-3-deoxygluconokinase
MTPRDHQAAPLAVGLGESLLRLSAPGHQRLTQVRHLDVHVGGAEMNGLIGLAALGFRCRWLTRLSDSPLGRRIVGHAAEHGVEPIVDWDPDARAPLYFVEHGVVPRPSEVLYDRSSTAMTRLTESTFSWEEEVRGAKVAMSTGITCALGPRPARAVSGFLAAARRAGARTVFDVNHRARLWTWEQSAPVLRRVLPEVDVLFTSRHDLLRLVEGATAVEDTVELARRAIKQWGHRIVVLRDTAQSVPGQVTVSATALSAEEVLTSSGYQAQVVDAFGAGDAALAAFVATWLTGGGLPAALEASAWACAFQHTVVGDAWQVHAADLEGRSQSWRILR